MKGSFFLAFGLDFLGEPLFTLFAGSDHFLVGTSLDGVEEGCNLAVNVEKLGLLVAKLNGDVAHFK